MISNGARNHRYVYARERFADYLHNILTGIKLLLGNYIETQPKCVQSS